MSTQTPESAVRPPEVTPASAAPGRPHRIRSMAVAEFKQFLRNKTLLVMAIVLPVGLPVGLLVMTMQSSDEAGDALGVTVASTMEIFFMFTFVFAAFYTLVSMITTRRDERVLKRFRTGESSDREIVIALSSPAVVLILVLTVLVTGIMLALSRTLPVSPIPLLIALAGGSVVFIALAFMTSAFTKNAEATQITSLPVVTIAAVGMTNIRSMLPEGTVYEVVSYSPMAAIADLTHLGWVGQPPYGYYGEPASGMEVLTESIEPSLILLGWIVVSIGIAVAYFRWDPRG